MCLHETITVPGMHIDSHCDRLVGFPGPGHQLCESVGREACDHALEHIAKVRVRFDAVEFAGFHQRAHRGPACTAAVGPSEQMVFPPEGNRAYRSLYGVGIEFDSTILDEATQLRPMS